MTARWLLVACTVLGLTLPGAAIAQEEDPTSIISIYRVAPGQHLDFVRWMAQQEAIATEAGVPAGQWYVHQNGDAWDFLVIGTETTAEQDDRIDALARERGTPVGAAAALQFRQYIAWHTDTFAGGPMSAAELLQEIEGS